MIRSPGIVLRSLRFGDSQIIIDIFTESQGVVPFIVRTPRSGRVGAKASTWQPLALVEVVWDHRVTANLQKPRELTMWQTWRELPYHPMKTVICLYLAEFLSHALRSEQENGPLFDFVVGSLQWLDTADSRFANFHIVFLLHLARFLGFMPNVDDWAEGSYFDLQAASFAHARPIHPYYIEPMEAALVSKFFRMDYRTMRAVGMNGAMRRRTLELIEQFYRLHIPEFPELHSLPVLTELLS